MFYQSSTEFLTKFHFGRVINYIIKFEIYYKVRIIGYLYTLMNIKIGKEKNAFLEFVR